MSKQKQLGGWQMDQGQMFELSDDAIKQRENIIVIGVGGGGGNALNHIIESGLEGVEFIAANTDAKALALNRAPKNNHIILGEKRTGGLGAGANPEVGMEAAKESLECIKEHIEGAHMLFVTAGMGGGTGTGAAPVIAAAAKESGALVVGVVTLPFNFEMQKRFKTAQGGIENLKKCVDALLIVENDRLLQLGNAEKMLLTEAYAMVDEVLYQAVKGVTDLITQPGFINLDFADVRTVMSNAGTAIMGIGESDGDNRAEQAARAAIKSPLMSVPMEGAKGVLFNVTTGPDITLMEMSKAAEVVKSTADPEAEVIWGHVIDEKMGGKVRVTLIATGFPEGRALGRKAPSSSRVPEKPATRNEGTQQSSHARTIFGRQERGSFEETRLQSPSEDEMAPFRGLPKMPYDQPAIFRRRPRE